METSKLIESESTTASAPLKRQGDGENSEIEKKKPKRERVKLSSYDLNDIAERHSAYLDDNDLEIYVEEDDDGTWVVVPLERHLQKIGETYTVRRKMKGKCGWGWRCDYYCPDCNKCIHQFECDCEDGKEGIMCEHIHLVCRYVENKDDSQTSSEDNEEKGEKEEGNSSNSGEEGYYDDGDETDQRKASSIISELRGLLEEARDLVTGKKEADILKQNLKSTIALIKKNKK